MSTSHDLRCLAVMFRTNDPNIGHVSTLDLMTEAGLAYTHGLFRGIPKRHRKKRAAQALAIANALERQASRWDNA